LLSQIAQSAEAGADVISVHAENANAAEALDDIAHRGLAAGLVLKVSTPVSVAASHLPKLQFLTLLGTAIGVKGQSLDPAACRRLEVARRMISDARLSHRVVLAADGGIRENTVPLLRQATAETVVLGSLAFGATDLAARMKWLKAL
jgi:ribulose-phosphate 3-epimerase